MSLSSIPIYLTSRICSTLFISCIVIIAFAKYYFDPFNCLRFHTSKKPDEVDINSTVRRNSSVEPFPNCNNKIRISKHLRYYAQLLSLELTEYEVTTPDGFILVLQHLYDPKILSAERGKPVLFLHGLMQSSASFLSSGKKSLAYHLLCNGYDIWLGNNRCGFKPKHLEFGYYDKKLWDWDMNELAIYDLPTLIENVVKLSNWNGKINLVSHSQGTTQSVMLSTNQYYNPVIEKIDKCVLLAPAIYGGPLLNEKLFIRFIKSLNEETYKLFFGNGPFMSILMHMRNLSYKFSSFSLSSYVVFNYLFDWDNKLWDHSLQHVHFLFSPVFVSAKLMKWWLLGEDFRFNKPIINNPNSWFHEKSPLFLLVIAGKDSLVNGELFVNRLVEIETEMVDKYEVLRCEDYSHLDVIWADDVLERVGAPILKFLK